MRLFLSKQHRRITKRTLCGVRRSRRPGRAASVALRIKAVELNRPPLWGLYQGDAGVSWAGELWAGRRGPRSRGAIGASGETGKGRLGRGGSRSRAGRSMRSRGVRHDGREDGRLAAH